jgi:hypothetical protein
MNRIALVLILSLLATLAVAAQDKPKTDAPKDAAKSEAKPSAAMPAVDDILDNYVKALGGKDAIEKLTTRASKGAFELPAMGASGTVEAFTKAPNKSASIIEMSGFGKIERIFDGAKAWSASPMEGVRELEGAELALMKRQADFHSSLNIKKNFAKLEVKGVEKVVNTDAYMVVATPAEGKAEKMYFDVNSGLLVRHDIEMVSPQGEILVETLIEDYKVVDGVKIPFTIKQNTPAFNMVLKYSEIKHNVPVDDAKFGKPKGQ